jgi:hypothetical protein
MSRKKAFFIIPGFAHRATNKPYKKIAKILEKEGYAAVPISVPWKKGTILSNTEYFLEEYKKVNAKKKYILGFSYGAMIAFLASTKVDVEGLVLCSLSPYFREDVRNKRKRANKDLAKLRFARLAKKIRAEQTFVLYGTREAYSLINRTREAFDKISSPDKFLLPVDRTEHNIGSRRYLAKIHQAAKVLN